ncbi:MAG: lamin tail domain-containing protein [Deltaproteobacteria bacterium]|nr:lamin tail domain-containing protein [Deltaproteobacteria bacterium]
MNRFFLSLFFAAAFACGGCDDGATPDNSDAADTMSGTSDATLTDNAVDTGTPSREPDGTQGAVTSTDTGAQLADDSISDTAPDTAATVSDTAETGSKIPADTAWVSSDTDDTAETATADTGILDTSDDAIIDNPDSDNPDSPSTDTGDNDASLSDTAVTDTVPAESTDTDTAGDTETTTPGGTDTEPSTDLTDDDDMDSDSALTVDTDSADLRDTDNPAEDQCVPTLVINEVDYDVPGKDTAEFVELFNPTACAMPLAGLALILVNGSDMMEYRRISLSDAGVEVVPAQSYLVIHGAELTLSADVPALEMSLANGFIQNGPDGLALYDDTTQSLLDAFCYEAGMTETWFDDIAVPFNLVEGEMNPDLIDSDDEGVSLSRIPNGADSGNSATDWALATATPGAENIGQ